MANEYHTYLSNLTFTYDLVGLISVKKGRYRIIAPLSLSQMHDLKQLGSILAERNNKVTRKIWATEKHQQMRWYLSIRGLDVLSQKILLVCDLTRGCKR